ncbi:type II toxin-antitoxin system VapC family toxin [Dyadobacter sp. CY312]|uniref:type II toxin-antitoxin system VapC family toxin n=1 Tax=Dyadobacter sp. CY312 TaxID=2907303 RepID=UPI001F2A11EB|nr:type II toxin-antitoxin system VapC family toxin [Dyadobacter sp. CY312]MCE7040545.1 type II toxin-antitoxin system VapC family toxin [Dyadobacter sp. CY312]
MKYLVDTQILIWAITDPKKLAENTLSILRNNRILVPQISLFEISIKQKINKLPELNIPINDLIERMRADNFEILPLSNDHITKYGEVPMFPDHRDPFDRLIIATALHENITLISADEKFRSYKEIINLIENN